MSEGIGVNLCNSNKGIWENYCQSWKNPGSTEDRKGDLFLLVRAIAFGIFRALSYLTLVVPLVEIAFLVSKSSSSSKSVVNNEELKSPNIALKNLNNQIIPQVQNQVQPEPPKTIPANNPQKVALPNNQRKVQDITMTVKAWGFDERAECVFYNIEEKGIQLEGLEKGSKIKLIEPGPTETICTIVSNEELSNLILEQSHKPFVGIITRQHLNEAQFIYHNKNTDTTYKILAKIS